MSGTGNNSTLEITVITTGISGNGGAGAQLGRLGEAAAKAETKVEGLTAKIQSLLTVQRSATSIAQNYANAIQSTMAQIGGSSSGTNTLAAATTKLGEAMLMLSTTFSKVGQNANQSATGIKFNTDAMKDAHAAARGLTGSLGALWLTYGNMLPLAAGAAIGASFKQIVTIGASVEHTLEGIRVRGEESVTSINNMRDSIMDLGKGVYGPQEVAKGFETLILAGLKAEQAIFAIKDALNLATVGGTTLEKSAEVLVQVGTALGYDAEAYGRVSDVIAKSAAVSMSSVESISESFKSGSAVGKAYGATLVDIGAAYAMMSNLGIKGTAAGTSLKNFYSYLTNGSDKVTNALSQVGLKIKDLQDASGKMLPLVDVFSKLSDGMNKFLDDSAQKSFMANVSNQQGFRFMVEGISQVRKAGEETSTAMGDTVKKINESFGYAAIGAASMALTVESNFKSVKNTLQTQFLGAFQDIQAPLNMVAYQLKTAFNSDEFKTGVQGIAMTLANLALGLANNIGLITDIIAAFLLFKAVSFVAGTLFAIVEAVKAFEVAMVAGRVAAIAFQASLGLLGVALAAAAAAWVWYKSKKDEANNVDAGLKYMGDFTESLNKEADRLERQNQLLREKKTLSQAVAQSSRESQLGEVNIQGEKAVAAAVREVVDMKEKLSESEKRSYERAKAMGATGINNIANVNSLLKAERNVQDVIAKTTAERENAAKAADRLNTAAKTQAELADAAAKAANANPNAGEGQFEKLSRKKGSAKDPMDKENDEFTRRMEQMAVAQAANEEMIRGMQAKGGEYEKLGQGAKLVMKYEYELAVLQMSTKDAIDKQRESYLLLEIAKAKVLQKSDEELQFMKDTYDKGEALRKSTEERISSINTEAAGIERKVATYGMLKGATDALIVSELEKQRAELIGQGQTGQIINDLDREIAARQRLAVANNALGAKELETKSLQELDKFLNPKKALDFGNSMKEAFGQVGAAIDAMGKALDDYSHKQDQIAKERTSAMGLPDLMQRAKVLKALDDQEKKNALQKYGDISHAFKGMFKEHTAAYKVLSVAEKTFRAMELMETIRNTAAKVLGSEAVVASKGAEILAAEMGVVVDTTTTGSSLANSAIRTGANLAEGASKMFAMLGPWGVVGVAAMLAVMASFGFSGSGGGGQVIDPNGFEARQKKQGTGSVLGDDSAKSESIKNSIARLAENSDITLPFTSKMLMSLKNIEAGIGGMANFIARSTGLRGTLADEKAVGVGSSKGTWGFSDSKTELTDSGILFAQQSVAQAKAGIQASSYQDVHKESSSWWGLSKSSSNQEMLGQLDQGLSKQISLTVADMFDTITTAATALGKSGPEVTNVLNSMNLGLDRISLKGLSGDALVKELEAVFSQLGDNMAENVLGGFQSFQKVGEGYLETVTRVATGMEQAKQALNEIGLTAVGLYEITNKQGDLSAEIVRKTITNEERGMVTILGMWGSFGTLMAKGGPLTGIGEIIQTLNGSASDLIATYKQLTGIRTQMKDGGLGENLNRAMVIGAGSLEKLSTGMNDFIDGMFTDAEKLQMQTKSMTESFAALGFGLPATSAAFKELVQSIAASGNMELAGRLIAMSGGFNSLQSAMKDAAAAAKDAADAAAEKAKQDAADAKAAREKLLTGARDNLTKAYQKEQQTLTETKTKFEEFAKSLKSFRDGLLTGSNSPLTPSQKYAAASAAYATTSAAAQAGDKDAISKFQDVANQLLSISREYNASGGAYMQDFNRVMTESGMLADYASKQVDVATASLTALEKQVSGLMEVNASVMSVVDAVQQLRVVMLAQGLPMPATAAMDGSHADGLSYVPFDGYRAELHKGEAVLTASENKQYQMGLSGKSNNGDLVDELKALREEVKQLKEEQRQQTQALIGSNYDAQNNAACAVVDGVSDALSQSARSVSIQPALN